MCNSLISNYTFECFLGIEVFRVVSMQIDMSLMSYFYYILPFIGSSTPKSKVRLQITQRISAQMNKNLAVQPVDFIEVELDF